MIHAHLNSCGTTPKQRKVLDMPETKIYRELSLPLANRMDFIALFLTMKIDI